MQTSGQIADIAELPGENPEQDGLRKTPERWERAMRFLTSGCRTRLGGLLSVPLFTARFGEMVLIRDIGFFSFCEHELLPFWGRMNVAYLAGDKEIRPGGIPRIVNMLARRLQVQERLTHEVAGAISDAIDPRGVAVMCEASHLCMMRGMDKRQSATVTSAMRGAFRDNKALRGEFFSLLGRGHK